MADLSYAFGLEPEQAVKYFEGLGFNVPSDWKVTWNEAQAKARAIAGIHKQDIVAQIHGALYESLKNGTSFEKFRDDVVGRLKQHDWQLLKDGDIVNANTGEVDGKGYHIDDPFWNYFYPPNGFNCRCTVRAFSDRDLKRRNLLPQKAQLEDTEVVVNRKGDTRPAKAVKLADGSRFYTDAGFQNNVGKSHLANLGQLQMQRAVDLPPKLASVAIQEALKEPKWRAAISKQASEMVDRVNMEKFARGEMLYIGALAPSVLEALAAKNVYPQSAVIAMSDERILHAIRNSKNKPLPLAFWKDLPEQLQNPEAILIGTAGRNADGQQFLLFVYPGVNNKGKLVVTVDYQAKARNPYTGKKEAVAVNMVNTGNYAEDGDIYKNDRYELIWKK